MVMAAAKEKFHGFSERTVYRLANSGLLSIGRSDDWSIAVQHGSTMVRIGTAIFGAREY